MIGDDFFNVLFRLNYYYILQHKFVIMLIRTQLEEKHINVQIT